MKRFVWMFLIFFLLTCACGGVNPRVLLPGSTTLPTAVYRQLAAPGSPETEVEPLSRLQPGTRARSHLEALSVEIGKYDRLTRQTMEISDLKKTPGPGLQPYGIARTHVNKRVVASGNIIIIQWYN